jgi:hypothetical protein
MTQFSLSSLRKDQPFLVHACIEVFQPEVTIMALMALAVALWQVMMT